MESQYRDLIKSIVEVGEERDQERTGTGTLALFNTMPMVSDIGKDGIPILTSKKTFFKGALRELIWFLSGSTNVGDLHPSILSWWAPFAKEDGSLGPTYGHQWRSGHDQLARTVERLKYSPQSRRHIVSLWDAHTVDQCALPPCHGLSIQFYVTNDKRLNVFVHQRSGDMFLGVPINMVSYALLLSLVSKECGYSPGILSLLVVDAHVYNNHIDQTLEMLNNDIIECDRNLVIDDEFSLFNLKEEHVRLENYRCHQKIAGSMSV